MSSAISPGPRLPSRWIAKRTSRPTIQAIGTTTSSKSVALPAGVAACAQGCWPSFAWYRRRDRSQVVRHALLAEVLGPAERRGVEPAVADARIGAEPDEHAGCVDLASARGSVQRGFPLLLHRDVRPGAGVHIPAELGQQRESAPGSPSCCPHDQPRTLLAGPADMGAELFSGAPVARQRRGD